MSYQVLARKWRPNTFSELVGQEHVVAAITNALDNDRLHHAYLFTGTRGVGKTTIARIFAKSLNCEEGMGSTPCGVCPTCKEIEQGNFVDLLEIDAASRTKVEDTRELLDNVQYKPTRAQYKVYLIDEVHMLSKHSFNALLKTLEEPPPHVKFLLATTDPQKLPITILSRCLQFTLKALTRDQIQKQLAYILEQENLVAESAALHELARAAQGSMRDSLSLTDQAIAQGNGQVTAQVVADMLGLLDRNVVLKLLHAILKKDKHQVLQIIDDLSVQSPDFSQLLGEIMSYLHQIALTQFVPEACKLETHAARAVFTLAKSVPPEQVQLLYQVALQGRKDLPHAVEARIGLEMTLLRMLAFVPDNTMLQSEEVASIFTSLPKMSLTTLEQERQQSHVTPAVIDDARSNASTTELAEPENSLSEQKKTELDTIEQTVSEPEPTATSQVNVMNEDPLVQQTVSPEEDAKEQTAEETTTADLAAPEPGREEPSTEEAVTEEAATQETDNSEEQAIEQDLNVEQESLLQHAESMRTEALGNENLSPSSDVASDTLESEDTHVISSEPETEHETPEPNAVKTGNTSPQMIDAISEANHPQVSRVEDDPQLVDAYSQYLSSMPVADDEYSVSEMFDPESLLATPVADNDSLSLSLGEADTEGFESPSSTDSPETESAQPSLINTEELLALRTQITDKIQENADDGAQSDEGTDAIDRALKNNLPAGQSAKETLESSLTETKGEAPENTEVQAQNSDLAQDLPPWEAAPEKGMIANEVTSQNDSSDPGNVSASPASPQEQNAPLEAATAEEDYPVEYYQQFVSQPEPVAEESEEPVFVDTRSGWLPGMYEPAQNNEALSDSPQENTDSSHRPTRENDNTHPEEVSESLYKEVDFDIPYQLSDGKKVVKASQLDTWSQLIESMGLSGLTKQVAIHSMYKMHGDEVLLTVAEDKQHLVGPKTIEHLTAELTQALRHTVSVGLEYGEVTDTPFAVQQAINRMRMQYAHKAIAADPQVQLLCQTFNAEVISESIKPK